MKNKILLILLPSMILGLSACGSNGTDPLGSVLDKTYTITWKNYDGNILETDKNVKEGEMPHYDGEDPTRPDDNEYTYTWTGWTPELAKVTADQTYTATYSSSKLSETFTITYDLDGGVNDPSNPDSYVSGSSFLFADATKTGYGFVGWFNPDGQKIVGVSETTRGNLSLTAHWDPNKNELEVTSESEKKGKVSITAGSGYSDESTTVVAIPNLGYKFEGWYNQGTKISTETTYTFTMPTNDYSLLARFNIDDANAEKYGVIPTVSQDGKTVTYGLYPQTYVSDASTVNALDAIKAADINGWYRYNDNYYAKTEATPRNKDYQFSNGTKIVEGTTYWFKVEPIKWNVLKKSNGEYFLLTSLALDIHCYHASQELRTINNYYVYPNDYEDSDMRAWLNGDFYNTAFYLDDDNIKETLVDNSAETTNSPANHYWCNNTQDKVFLPSYQDYINPDYGFEASQDSTATRHCKTTDWAKAKGIYYNTTLYKGNVSYWTRSPDTYKNSEYTAWVISYTGGIGFDAVDYNSDGARMAIYLQNASGVSGLN